MSLTSISRSLALMSVLGAAFTTACIAPTGEATDDEDPVPIDSTTMELKIQGSGAAAQHAKTLLEGLRVFTHEDFDGNGRTCESCHSLSTGTFSLAEARARYNRNPNDPLFRPIDSDNGDGASYSRLLRDGTVRVTIPLPPWVKLADDPTATEVTLFRGVPSTNDTPALDPVLMYDGREPDLLAQAASAVQTHYNPGRLPTQKELEGVAAFQQELLFSSVQTLLYANGGPAPGLPAGRTASEKRGRDFFVDAPFAAPASKKGVCALCHSGPMLNETNQFTGAILAGEPAGLRFNTVGVSERNLTGNPVRTWLVDAGGGFAPVVSPDIGVVLTNPIPELPPYLPPIAFSNGFKAPSLRGIKRTAPYFHDGSAKSLEDVASHYDWFFTNGFGLGGPPVAFTLTAQEQADIVAYMKLL